MAQTSLVDLNEDYELNLENIVLIDLFKYLGSVSSCIEFLVRCGLIDNVKKCKKCHKDMTIRKQCRKEDGLEVSLKTL